MALSTRMPRSFNVQSSNQSINNLGYTVVTACMENGALFVGQRASLFQILIQECLILQCTYANKNLKFLPCSFLNIERSKLNFYGLDWIQI